MALVVDSYLRWTFVLDEDAGFAQTLVGPLPDRVEAIEHLAAGRRVLVDKTGLGLPLFQDLLARGVDALGVRRTPA